MPQKNLLVLRVLLILIAAGFLPAMPALAHANLVSTTPSDRGQVEDMPATVSVKFDEPVSVPAGALRVFNSDGDRVDLGDPAGTTDGVTVSIDQSQGDGWYIASWRIVSEDGHPLRGAFTFEVGEGGAQPDPSTIERIIGGGTSGTAALLGVMGRSLAYGGGLVAAGSALFLLLPGTSTVIDPVRRLGRRAAIVAIGASFLLVPVLAIEVQDTLSFAAIAEAVLSPVGLAAGLRVLALTLLIGGVTRTLVIAGVVLLVGAEMAAGHSLTAPARPLMMAATAVHVAAAAVWVGGLAALYVSLRSLAPSRDAPAAGEVVGSFSRLAGWSVAALSVAGLSMAWAYVGTIEAVTTTAYGWTLLIKVVIVVLVLAVARYNRLRLVPSVQTDDPRAWDRLRHTLRLEAAGLSVVVVATGLLVNLPPAAEAISAPTSVTVPFGDGQLNLVVDPSRTGVNEIHVYLLDSTGFPASASAHVTLELTPPGDDLAPLERHPNIAGPGHWIHIGDELSLAGGWDITIRLVENFEETAVSIPVTVAG